MITIHQPYGWNNGPLPEINRVVEFICISFDIALLFMQVPFRRLYFHPKIIMIKSGYFIHVIFHEFIVLTFGFHPAFSQVYTHDGCEYKCYDTGKGMIDNPNEFSSPQNKIKRKEERNQSKIPACSPAFSYEQLRQEHHHRKSQKEEKIQKTLFPDISYDQCTYEYRKQKANRVLEQKEMKFRCLPEHHSGPFQLFKVLRSKFCPMSKWDIQCSGNRLHKLVVYEERECKGESYIKKELKTTTVVGFGLQHKYEEGWNDKGQCEVLIDEKGYLLKRYGQNEINIFFPSAQGFHSQVFPQDPHQKHAGQERDDGCRVLLPTFGPGNIETNSRQGKDQDCAEKCLCRRHLLFLQKAKDQPDKEKQIQHRYQAEIF